MRASFPIIACLFADGGYAGDKLELAMAKTDGPLAWAQPLEHMIFCTMRDR